MTRCVVVLAALALSACGPSTFLINRDGVSSYFGRGGGTLQKRLCAGNDLAAILSDANLPADIREDFTIYSCSKERSSEKVLSLYLFLTPEQKKDLKQAFVRHGYEVNHINC